MNCIFCKIVNNEIPSYKLYEDDYVVSFLDVNPTSCGHSLIIPKVHFTDLDEIDIDTLKHIFEAAKIVKKMLDEKLCPDGMTLVQNNGFVQEVKHYHLHLIPKYKENNDLYKNCSIEEIYKKIKEN